MHGGIDEESVRLSGMRGGGMMFDRMRERQKDRLGRFVVLLTVMFLLLTFVLQVGIWRGRAMERAEMQTRDEERFPRIGVRGRLTSRNDTVRKEARNDGGNRPEMGDAVPGL
jgi:preprotein translocase subunit SecG